MYAPFVIHDTRVLFQEMTGVLTHWREGEKEKRNHGTQDSRVVPHRGTNWAALWLTAQIERDAVLSKPYGRGYCTL